MCGSLDARGPPRWPSSRAGRGLAHDRRPSGQLAEPGSEASSKRYDRECRIREARGREHGRARHVEILHIVDAAVRVDHAQSVIDVHPSGTGMVARVRIGAQVLVDLDSPVPSRLERLSEKHSQSFKLSLLRVGPSPVQNDAPTIERVLLISERDAIVRVRCLLEIQKQSDIPDFGDTQNDVATNSARCVDNRRWSATRVRAHHEYAVMPAPKATPLALLEATWPMPATTARH